MSSGWETFYVTSLHPCNDREIFSYAEILILSFIRDFSTLRGEQEKYFHWKWNIGLNFNTMIIFTILYQFASKEKIFERDEISFFFLSRLISLIQRSVVSVTNDR